MVACGFQVSGTWDKFKNSLASLGPSVRAGDTGKKPGAALPPQDLLYQLSCSQVHRSDQRKVMNVGCTIGPPRQAHLLT